uniref:Uncharacterized protein n=1 Tax=Dulem virus 35 TaxID=3145753 RepID=A0AAU8B1C8_9CAUD
MDDVGRFMINVIKPVLKGLSQMKIGLYDFTDKEGIHYIFNGKSYLITVKREDK